MIKALEVNKMDAFDRKEGKSMTENKSEQTHRPKNKRFKGKGISLIIMIPN